MLRPSYAELMNILNEESEGGDEVTSRYTIVIAAAKRARQLIDGDEPMVDEIKGKPVSTAVEELAENKIKIVPEGQGTVLKLKKDEELKNEVSEEISSDNKGINSDFDDDFDNMVDETEDDDFEDIEDFEDFDEFDDFDEFEDEGISDTMIEEEGEF